MNAIPSAMSPPAVRMSSKKLPRFNSTKTSEGRVAISQQMRRFHFVCSSMMSESASEMDQYVVSMAKSVKTEPRI